MRKRISDIDRALQALKDKEMIVENFLATNVENITRERYRGSENSAVQTGKKKALALFHEVSEHVPAYKDFLKKHKVDPQQVKTMEDFSQRVPILTKENYVDVYPIASRMNSGKLSTSHLIAASSGTTGTPRLWPRTSEQEFESGLIHELLFTDLFGIKKNVDKKTLVIIGFPLGIYISGMATAFPSFLLTEKGYPFTMLTSGLNVDGVIQTILQTHSSYDNVLLIGHPFFIKGLMEKGKAEGINWKKLHVRSMMCSEGFTEEWRDYLHSFLSPKEPITSILNTYGSSEFLLMANETPLTIAMRRAAKRNRIVRSILLDDNENLPQLFQFDPRLRYVESVEGALLFTANSGIPLIRYSLGDRGEVLSLETVKKTIQHGDTSLSQSLFRKNTFWNLPFIILRGRLDHSVLFYGINMYPEFFHHALNAKTFLKEITGKFAIEKHHTNKMEPYLVIHIELQQGKKNTRALAKKLEEHIEKTLRTVSIEYRFLTQSVKNVSPSKVTLWEYQSPEYFAPGIKPKYIIR